MCSKPTTVVGVALGIGAVLGSVVCTAQTPPGEGIQAGDLVVVSRANVRLMLGNDVIAELPRGTRLAVTQVQGDWVGAHVAFGPAPKPGWVRLAEVSKSAAREPDDPAVVTALQRLGAKLQFDTDGRTKTLTLDDLEVTDATLSSLQALSRLKALHGCRTRIGDAALDYLAPLAGLDLLDLRGTKVSDAGMPQIARMTQLKELWLSDTPITDAGAASLKGLTRLTTLDLGGTKVTDAALVYVRGLPALESLWLGGAEVSDAGLEQLAGLKRLQVLMLKGTRVTKDGVARLKRSLPAVVVDY